MIFEDITLDPPAARAGLAALCFAAGVAAGVPLYTTYWWWDLFAHGLGGVALTTGAVAAGQSPARSLLFTATVAVGWELVEPHLSTVTPLTFVTGDWPSDIAATVAGAVLVAVVHIVTDHD